MALTIVNPEAARLAKELAAQTGESVDDAVLHALKRAMLVEQRTRASQAAESQEKLLRVVSEIQERIAKLPVLDDRSPDELLGYDESGLPH